MDNGKQAKLVQAKLVHVVNNSLATKYLWSHLCVNTINKLKSQCIWHVHHAILAQRINQIIKNKQNNKKNIF